MAVNARTEKFQHIEVFDKPALFTNGRIARDTVPKGWYCYDIRGSDDDPGELCYMEENVVVNHAGSVLMPEKLAMPIWKVFSTKRSMCGIMRATMRFRRERSMKRILFICHGNICRSPMAEFVMKDLVKKAGLTSQFHIESAATSREEIGNPVYPPARRKLAEHGISCEGHAARQLTNRDYDEYDLLIGMDQANLRDMYRICGGDYVGKMSLLMDHTAHPGNVADPWYTEDFEATWQDVLDGCQGLLKEFMAERGDSNGTKR